MTNLREKVKKIKDNEYQKYNLCKLIFKHEKYNNNIKINYVIKYFYNSNELHYQDLIHINRNRIIYIYSREFLQFIFIYAITII